jgi:hypothetical protein
MDDPQELRDLARKCRMLTNISLKPSVNKQLWLWAAELADYADEIERRPGRGPSAKPGCARIDRVR